MSNFRYYVHTVQVVGEQPVISSQLAIFLENRAFTTQDLPSMSVETMNYSRRCIDACDFVIMVVGESYGQTNASGVSQLHLSYLSAKTKNKPMLIFIKSIKEQYLTRQLKDFIRLLEEQHPYNLYHYTNEQVFNQYLNNVYDAFVNQVTIGIGWVRANPINGIMTEVFNKSLSAPYQGNNIINKKTSAMAGTALDNLSYASLSDSIEKPNINKSDIAKDEKVKSVYGDNIKVNLDDNITIHYKAHAYQDGNLNDVSLTMNVSWRRILIELSDLGGLFSGDAMYRRLNDMVAQSACETVKQIMPQAHAVSRCQVDQTDLLWIQSQLQFNDWLEVASVSQRISRKFWQLTNTALTIVSKA